MNRSEPSATEVADVVARAKAGAWPAIGTLYHWYAPDVLRLVTRLLASYADAEDVVHDLFVGMPEHLQRYDERGQLRAWLRATAVGMARMRLRKDSRRVDVLARDPDPIGAAKSSDPAIALDVARAVASLPESLRAVFVLKQWEGYSHDEIAALLEISPGAARVRYSRALASLRSALEP